LIRILEKVWVAYLKGMSHDCGGPEESDDDLG
jgi:hypothetical protein